MQNHNPINYNNAEQRVLYTSIVPGTFKVVYPEKKRFSFGNTIRIIGCLILLATSTTAQNDRFVTIENKLKEIAAITPGLNEKVELSVNGVSIQDFIRGLATTNNLNVSIDANLTAKIYNNFSSVTVSDILLFLIKKYDLDVTFIGNIISFTQFSQPPAVITTISYVPKEIKISYDTTSNLLSLDLNQDSLALVAKEITRISEKNIVFAPDLAGKIVNGYIRNMVFNAAMDKLAFANDLKITATKDNSYLIEKADIAINGQSPATKTNNYKQNKTEGIDLKSDGNNLLTIEAVNAPIADLLAAASSELKINYFLFIEPKGNTSLNIKGETYDEFLNHLFNGTEYSFKKEGGIYLIGERNLEGLRATKVISLKYRTVEKVIDFIPAELKKGMDVKAFNDQNSIIVSGSQKRIDEIQAFLRDIDRVVPVISIEVMIVDVNNSHTVSAGIKAGLGPSPTKTGGDVFPSLDFKLGANSINSVIDGINGTGIVNLGKVTPNFYLSLQLMEQNGDVKINSTPLLSTLNGNEAKMSIGETRYYRENNTNTISTQSTTVVQSVIYKPLEAKFSMTINPIVSGDEQITLEIAVTQSSFTNQSGPEGSPFNQTSRDFKSLIRVKNQEMIMLGGLDNENKSETGSGVPILSRIPVLKWFFGIHTKTKSKSKMTIFIKPTVIY